MNLYEGEISEIFIGRKDDLGTLQKKLDGINKQNEAKKAYTVLNVPCIGKTELIKHFGESLQKKNPFKYDGKNSLEKIHEFFSIPISNKKLQLFIEIIDR